MCTNTKCGKSLTHTQNTEMLRWDTVWQNDECPGCCHHLLQRMTIVCRQRSKCRKICPRDQSPRSSSTRPLRAEPTTAVHTAYITGFDPQASARSVTPKQISFGALSEDAIPLKGCVLWNRRAFMVIVMASAKDRRKGRVWSRECGSVRMNMFLCRHIATSTSPSTLASNTVRICCPRFQLKTMYAFCTVKKTRIR